MSAKPQIERLSPAAALPGGEIKIHGRGLMDSNGRRPRVTFGDSEAAVLAAADEFLIARVPERTQSGSLRVATAAGETDPAPVEIGVPIADNLHPVANPAIDSEGNIYVTFSGARGQQVPVSLYRIDRNFVSKPFLTGVMNATGLALDRDRRLYVSSRHEGMVYQVTPEGKKTRYAEGMGIATGIAFDADESLYVGDRSGTIFKVGRDRQIFVFATLEPSIAAYHLAFGPDRQLYVTGPTTSSFDSICRINERGQVSVFYRGLGRPQGLAFDVEGNLYCAASLHGRRGLVRFSPDARAELVVSGEALVGLAFAPSGLLLLATTSALYSLNWPVAGLPLLS